MNLQKSLEFMMELEVNNDRNWFKDNDQKYRIAKASFESFIDELIPPLKKMDGTIDIENSKPCMFRIFRDVRFSKNKAPYKTNFGAFIAKGGRKSNFAGYYVHLQPEQSFLGGGVYMPEAPYLKAIRTSIFKDPARFKSIISNTDFKTTFGDVYGEKLKTAPKGFPKDFPDIDLLKNKHYVVTHPVANEFWLGDDPVNAALAIFKKQFEFNQYLNEVIDRI
jgi:uncharacterized protein (TIGR02453 family)